MSALLWRALVALLVLFAVAGCAAEGDEPATSRATSSPTAERPRLEPGTCWTDQQVPEALGEFAFAQQVEEYARGDQRLGAAMRDDAAFVERVDCAEPHALELYGVVTVAPKLLARVTEYADLLDDRTPLYRKIRDQVNDRCAAGSAYGRAERKAGLQVQLGPALAPESGLHLAWDPFPPELWEQGRHKFVCTFEQDRPGTLRYADLATRRVPVRARVCLNTPGTFVPCRRPHQAEDIGEMILNSAIETGQVDARKAVRKENGQSYIALSEREYERLDKVCQTLLDMVSTNPHRVVGRAYPGAVAQWPTKQGTYVATCFALRPYDPPPKIRGTVFDRR